MKSNCILLLALSIFVFSGCSIQPTSNSNSEVPTPSQTTSASSPTPIQELSGTYTLEDVAQHNSTTDCWMVIDNNVYDVTEFVGKHPGGKAILNGCGEDATTLFKERPSSGKGPHPAQAEEMLPQFLIGTVQL